MEPFLTRNMKSVYRRRQLGLPGPTGPRRAKLSTILVCSEDARVVPADVFDLVPGEVHVLRTAGPVVTNDVLRSIFAIMAVESVQTIVVLGNTDSLLSDPALLSSGRGKLAKALPANSPYATFFSSRDRASTFFSAFTDPVQNIFVQVNNLSFLKQVHKTVTITGMLYNVANGHVYGLDELKEMRQILVKNPDTRIESIVPRRYDAFESEQQAKKNTLVSKPSTSKPARAATASSLGPGTRDGIDELVEASPAPGVDEILDLPNLVDTSGITGAMEDPFSATRDQLDIMMGVVSKVMSRGVNVKVFVPKIRVPKVRVPGTRNMEARGQP